MEFAIVSLNILCLPNFGFHAIKRTASNIGSHCVGFKRLLVLCFLCQIKLSGEETIQSMAAFEFSNGMSNLCHTIISNEYIFMANHRKSLITVVYCSSRAIVWHCFRHQRMRINRLKTQIMHYAVLQRHWARKSIELILMRWNHKPIKKIND